MRALFVACNNPAVTCPDASAVRRGLSREDLFTVVHDPFLSDTARYADVVLPAATYLETEDVHRAYGTYYLQFANRVVEPQGEAWPNQRLAQELARRLGVTDHVFSMDTDALLGEIIPSFERSDCQCQSRRAPGFRSGEACARAGPSAVRDPVG